MTTHELHVNGVALSLQLSGSGPLVLCLHGFPDTARTWATLVPELVEAGYRVAVPSLRGYSPSGLAADGDYSQPTLGRDVLALIAALGERRATIIGHDWGAVAAYAAAALDPRAVRGIAVAAVPHPARFLRLSPAQLRRSWYMGLFQLPGIAEVAVRRDNFALIERLWRAWSPGWQFTAADLEPVRQCLAQPGVLSAVLAYYRALPRGLLAPSMSADRRRLLAPLSVPALAIAGADDGCIGAGMFQGQERWFRGGYEFALIPKAGHFMHREQPGRFADAVLRFLEGLA